MVFSISLVAASAIAFPHPDGGAPAAPPKPDVLDAWTLVELELPAAPPESFSVSVELGGTPTTIVLSRFTLRSGAFEVLVDEGNGTLLAIDPPAARTYRGSVVGDPQALVTASLLDDGLSAMIRTSGGPSGRSWFIEPVAHLSGAVGDPRHAIYSSEDVLPTDHHCGADSLAAVSLGGSGEGGIAGTPPNYAEIAIETDYEFFQKNGSNVTSTINDIELVMNAVDGVYSDDVGITFELTTIVVRSSAADPYAAEGINDRLCEFRNNWNDAPESSIQRDMAHMFSGVAFAGGTIGVAWKGVVCNVVANDCGGVGNLAYGIVESKYLGQSTTPLYLRTSLSCHEMGHNWDASHCNAEGDANCHIMCSSNNACGGVFGANLKFDPLSITEISAYKNSVSCEPLLADPQPLPFVDQFTAVTINATRWVYNKGAVVNSAGVGEPSPTLSLNLDSSGSNEFQDDEIRSNRILLAGAGAVNLTYFVEHVNVETGKQFFVDYFNSSGKWINLNTITSNGVNGTSYTAYSHALPSAAKHDGFRIRFRTGGDDGTDDWFVDDVRVELGAPCPGDVTGNGLVDGGDIAYLLGFWGGTGPQGDADGNGVVDGADVATVLGGWGACP